MTNPRISLARISELIEQHLDYIKKDFQSGIFTSDHASDLAKYSKVLIDISQDTDKLEKQQLDEVNKKTEAEVKELVKEQYNLIEADLEIIKQRFNLVERK